MIRLVAVSIALSIIVATASSAAAGSRRPRVRPNVVVVIADDLGWADVGYHGAAIGTPNLDALADAGIRLERFYAHPWCSPTRAAFLVGRFPPAYAWHVPGINVESEIGIDDSMYTIAERFQDAGYATGLIGKWHQGTRAESHPNQNGFDYFYGFLGGYVGFYAKRTFMGPHDWQRNGVEVFDEPDYATTLLGEDAARFVRERDPARPFFLVLSFSAPHFPQQAPPDVVERYASTTDCLPVRCGYMAQVDVMDREIGKLMDTVDAEGLREETLVVFFSDNGGAGVFGGSNAPLRGEKADTHEGAIRVPALMRWPAVLAAGQERQQRIVVSDLFATLEAAAGIRRRAPAESRNAFMSLVWNVPLRRGPLFFMNLPAGDPTVVRRRAAIVGDWKIVATGPDVADGASTAELYRIGGDPTESHDVAAGRGARFASALIGLVDRIEHRFVDAEALSRHTPRWLRRP
jgi:arylsulfatase A-like enzyme